eukprot:25468-Eustigmatos_ZCMA.PRE.1
MESLVVTFVATLTWAILGTDLMSSDMFTLCLAEVNLCRNFSCADPSGWCMRLEALLASAGQVPVRTLPPSAALGASPSP